MFLCGIGLSIIAPVVPFLVQPYINNPKGQTIVVTLLTSVYVACVFFAAPGFGALNDRYGRHPPFLICLLGSVIGYLVFGIGGVLWVLFAGHVVEGITGRSISTIFAYFAGITPRRQRTKHFGWISTAAGVGTTIGPAVGGLLARFGYSTPMYCETVITLLNFVYEVLYMPKNLDKNHRLKRIPIARLNPFIQLLNVLPIKSLERLLISAFLLWIPNGALQVVFSQFTIDTFHWEPAIIRLMFSIMDVRDVPSQGFIMPRLLLKLSDAQIAVFGVPSEIMGYSLTAASTLLSFYPSFIARMFIFSFGDSIFGPSFDGMVSKSVDSGEQRRVQGGSQSIQALARIIRPITEGQIYVSLGHAAPASTGMLLIVTTVPVLYRSTRVTVEAA